MKRKDIEPRRDYVTKEGRRVTVVSTESGWAVQDGKHVRDSQRSHRYVGGERVEYETNTAIPVLEYPGKRKGVVEPRHLVGLWDDHVAQTRTAQQRQQEVRQAADMVTSLVRLVLPEAKVTYNIQKETATLSLDDLAHLAAWASKWQDLSEDRPRG